MGFSKGDTRSLDYSSYVLTKEEEFASDLLI